MNQPCSGKGAECPSGSNAGTPGDNQRKYIQITVSFLGNGDPEPDRAGRNYPLPEAQVDRFMLKVIINYPKKEEEKLIIRQNISGVKPDIKPILTKEEILEARKVVREVYLDEKIERYIVDIVFATRFPQEHGLANLANMISFGASPRASISWRWLPVRMPLSNAEDM